MDRKTRLAGARLLLAALPLGAVLRAQQRDEIWSQLRLEGQPAGYSRSLVETIDQGGERLLVTTEDTVLQFVRLGQTTRIHATTTTTETDDGKVRRASMDMDLSA